MTDEDAIAEFERWLASVEAQKQKAAEMQRLARLAKTDPDEAQKQLHKLDKAPRVYDGAKLYPAVRHAWHRLKAMNK